MRKILRALRMLCCVLVIFGAAKAAFAQQMTFRIVTDSAGCPSCVWLQATGEIVDATPMRFESFLHDNPFVTSIQIDSPGGLLEGALRMGDVIRARNLKTVVGSASIVHTGGDAIASRAPGRCMSACVYLLAAGIDRSQIAGSAIGVHQFYGDGASSRADVALATSQRVTGQLIDYLMRMGVSAQMLSAASTAGPDSVRILSADDALRFNLLTTLEHPGSRLPNANQVVEATADPFGDKLRVAPLSASECNEPYFSRADGSYTTTQLQDMNRYYRQLCEGYFETVEKFHGADCPRAWSPVYEALRKETASGFKLRDLPSSVTLQVMYAVNDCKNRAR